MLHVYNSLKQKYVKLKKTKDGILNEKKEDFKEKTLKGED